VLENSKTNYYKGRYPTAVLPIETDQQARQQFGWDLKSIFRPEKGNALRKFIDDPGEIRDDLEEGRKVRKKATKRFGEVKISEFNPHLCVMIVKYWSLPGQHIVDPFAGRATRGIITRMLERTYEGYEIAPTTFRNTSRKVGAVGGTVHNGDGCRLLYTKDSVADLVFTSPPYFKQEGHEDAKNQLSTLDNYEAFIQKIAECGRNMYRVMKPGAFLVWNCADFREKKKFRLFHEDASRVFQKAGLVPYDIVIVENLTPFAFVGTSAAALQRRTIKTHEYLQVFRKPDDRQRQSGSTDRERSKATTSDRESRSSSRSNHS